jgi:hypothetical protein
MNKLLKSYKKARVEYKVSLVAALLAMMFVPLMFFFVILPVYGAIMDPNGAEILDRAEKLQNIFETAMWSLIVVSAVAGITGFIRDARAKPKK